MRQKKETNLSLPGAIRDVVARQAAFAKKTYVNLFDSVVYRLSWTCRLSFP
jgi:hypothetical protein